MSKTPTPDMSGTTINQVGNGTEINGDINTSGDIRVDGTLVGNLTTKGKLVIGETGTVKGEITCKNSVVSGKIDGKINVAELLSLKASSKINGDIITQKLHIEPGAKFTGTCNMASNTSNVGSGGIKEEKKLK
jgi:cytoskeletal protein CcmA (bactofilin family)